MPASMVNAGGGTQLEVDLVFELPAKGLSRRGRGQAKQDTAVEQQRPWPDIVDRTKDLWADPVILLAQRGEMADGARLAISLEARFEQPAGHYPRLPRVDKIGMARRMRANIM